MSRQLHKILCLFGRHVYFLRSVALVSPHAHYKTWFSCVYCYKNKDTGMK